ncbi:hypothetical protein DC366_15180 [Pelagivirga sediminicola]|uniref:Uncharacterized protein n=1 Tax=Pelagivirga sediminicola TaxID=2170575 RepID=A0A2T7G491_9RHOB|nr:hypothetical protein [Pelagivirga sediminicola]PVA09239.1 hypothetical protein DC366_15180 [Pelagivirga sediminicola]
MPYSNDVSGAGALSICEALLLALNDRKILPEIEIMGILEDAAAAHEAMSQSGAAPQVHTDAASLIRQIITGGNSVRRP